MEGRTSGAATGHPSSGVVGVMIDSMTTVLVIMSDTTVTVVITIVSDFITFVAVAAVVVVFIGCTRPNRGMLLNRWSHCCC